MRMDRIITLFALLLFIVAGCSKPVDMKKDFTSSPIVVKPTVSAHSRASDTAFEEGDEIGLTIKTSDNNLHADNHQLTFAASTFSADQLTWYDSELTGDFMAYYPFSDQFPVEFSIRANQKMPRNYTRSDFMISVLKNVSPKLEGVDLTFDHMFSQLMLVIKNEDNIDIHGVMINNSIGTAVVDIENGEVRAKENGEKITIQPDVLMDGSIYKAVIVPQKTSLVVTIVDPEWKEYTSVLSETIFESKSYYTAEITLKNDVDFTKVPIHSTKDINNWGGGDRIEVVDEDE